MSFSYSRLQSTALRLIERFGTTAVLSRDNNTSTNIDPVDGSITPHDPTTGNFYAVNVASNSKSDFDNKVIGEAAKIGMSARFFVAVQNGTTMIPSGQGDTFTFDSKVYQVLGCTEVAPAGNSTRIVYRIGCAA